MKSPKHKSYKIPLEKFFQIRAHFLFAVFFLVSCNSGNNSDQTLKIELKEANEKIVLLESKMEAEGDLVHMVFFDLKEEVDRDKLIKEIKKLKEIPVVKDLQVGVFEDLNDQRAMSKYELGMEMSFDNKDAYSLYQKHPIHNALKENVKSLLSQAPRTYDYMKK